MHIYLPFCCPTNRWSVQCAREKGGMSRVKICFLSSFFFFPVFYTICICAKSAKVDTRKTRQLISVNVCVCVHTYLSVYIYRWQCPPFCRPTAYPFFIFFRPFIILFVFSFDPSCLASLPIALNEILF